MHFFLMMSNVLAVIRRVINAVFVILVRVIKYLEY